MKRLKTGVIILGGITLGLLIGYLITKVLSSNPQVPAKNPLINIKYQSKEVLGFLPYWLLDKARPDYTGFITTLDYFGLTIDKDGTILRSNSPVELEPGYYALTAGSLDPFFEAARAKNIKLSLTVFGGDQDTINELISDPIKSANNLINEVSPIMAQYGFSDLNLDIEPVGFASPSAQVNFTRFVSEVSSQVKQRKLGTLSIDIIPVDFIRNDHLALPGQLAKYVDKMILMAYDFHSPSSFVTGPVAPIYGAGSIAEFDTQVSINAAVKVIDSSKILLGVPTYGYSWETIDNFPRAAIVPSSVVIESNKDVEDFLSGCATCEAKFDGVGQEAYIIYKNQDSGTYQQIFYPEGKGIGSKINFVKGNGLGGVAIWALGYESSSILNPLQNYLKGL